MRTVSLEVVVDGKRVFMDGASTVTVKGTSVQVSTLVDGKRILATATLSPELDEQVVEV